MSELTKQADIYIQEHRQSVDTSYRNKYHAMPPIGWMNDPNGFSYAFGKYHLFYQFHPYSAVWGPMHWGHSTSDDLIRWEEKQVAIAPDMPYDNAGCFSGSAIVKDGQMYLMYTSASGDRQTQALAVSNDGVNFEKIGQVIKTEQLPADNSLTDFRDPKVIVKNGVYYSMIGATSKSGIGRILFYKSNDLINWGYVGVVLQDERTTVCECPDYFVLDGKEIILTSPQNVPTNDIKFQNQHSNIYLIGKLDFNTGKFDIAYEGELDSGFDFYAAQTLQAKDGRRILIAWMSMWDRTNITASHGWSGTMTLPRELNVLDNKIYQQPIREIENYRKTHYHIERKQIYDLFALPHFGSTQEICVTFDIETTQKVGLKLFCGKTNETLVYYDKQKDLIVFDRSKMGKKLEHGANERNADIRYGKLIIKDNILSMRLFLDVSSCEVFFGKGECVMTANIYADKHDNNNYLFVEGGTATVQRLDAYNLDINNF